MIRLACIADHGFARHTGAMLNSALARDGAGAAVHLLCGTAPEHADLDRLQRVVAHRGGRLHLHVIAPEHGAMFPDGYFPRAVWYRVLLPELLPDVDRVLYLDSDTIVADSLLPLWHTPLGDHLLAAVTNPFYPFMPPHPQSLGLAPGDYFNSGVLLMDLRRMRGDGFLERVREFARSHPHAPYPDQDALNVACRGRWLALHPRWNVQSTLYELDAEALPLPPAQVREALAHPAVIHYIGPFKPWHFLCRHPQQRRYFDSARETPWGEPPIEGRTLVNAVLRRLPLAWIDRWFALERRVRARLA